MVTDTIDTRVTNFQPFVQNSVEDIKKEMTNLEKEIKQVMIVCANVLDIGSTRLSCPVLIIEYLVFYAADLVL